MSSRNNSIGWGIIGTGAIAKKFATALNGVTEARLAAVGSRSKSTAQEFGAKHGVAKAHDSYRELMEDLAVDVVYVATPHSSHYEDTLAALNAGKAVLVEKPFTINAREAETLIECARSKRLLLMEAMWTRYLPLYIRLREMIAQGSLGEVRMMTADFGFLAGPNTNPRLLDPALGGGALLDIGVYPVSLASMIFGAPTEVISAATLGKTGVDEQDAIALRHSGGQMAVIACSLQSSASMEVMVMGTAARVRIHAPAWKSTCLTVSRQDQPDEVLQFPFDLNGLQFEAIEFMNCFRSGKLESAIMPLDETLSIMKTMDTLRSQWGLKYPMER
jgi:predicted dehydrogenase